MRSGREEAVNASASGSSRSPKGDGGIGELLLLLLSKPTGWHAPALWQRNCTSSTNQ
jgi:hypothetical protein